MPHNIDRKLFLAEESGAVTIDWVVLTAAVVGLGLSAVAMIRLPDIGLPEFGRLASGANVPRPAADIVMQGRRLPRNPDHPTLWANPFHPHTLPEGFPDIGGQPFTLSGDGNPRMLVAGADPRVISGAANPQFDMANYASSGTAFGSSQFHRILIDTPPANQTYRVQLNVAGQVIEYQFTNTPY